MTNNNSRNVVQSSSKMSHHDSCQATRHRKCSITDIIISQVYVCDTAWFIRSDCFLIRSKPLQSLFGIKHLVHAALEWLFCLHICKTTWSKGENPHQLLKLALRCVTSVVHGRRKQKKVGGAKTFPEVDAIFLYSGVFYLNNSFKTLKLCLPCVAVMQQVEVVTQ